jgi:hypothetical protein
MGHMGNLRSRLGKPVSETEQLDAGSAQRNPEETAAYLASISMELANLARGQGLELLAYLLEMAQLEAERIVQDSRFRRMSDDSSDDDFF